MALTTKKSLFCEAIMAGKNQTHAAIFAGYSENSAAITGSKLARDPDVISLLARLKAGGNITQTPDYQDTIKTVSKVAKENIEAVQIHELPHEKIEQKTIKVTVEDVAPIHMTSDPLEFMARMMNDYEAEPRLRLDAAKALASYKIPKPGEKGKKEQVQDEAEKVSSGRFGLRKQGQLRAVK